jgi:V8-like Glu-specific endopeptidase
MKGIEQAEIRDAITNAFSPDEFDMFLFEKLDYDRELEVGDGGFKKVADAVVKQFVKEGRDPYLIAAVAAVRPLKADVQQVYQRYARGLLSEAWTNQVEAQQLAVLEKYGLAPTVELQLAGKALSGQLQISSDGFQKQIKQALPLVDGFVWATQLLKQIRRVCRIEVDQTPLGTGFLVGPDAVLTNHHVLRSAIAAKLSGKSVQCLFELWKRPDGMDSEGVRVGALGAFDDWHVDSSPGLPSPAEDAGAPPPSTDQLDHAIFRLERRFGEEPIFPGGPVRGWVRVPATAPTLAPEGPVTILQHPGAQPIKIAFDFQSILTVNENRTRVRYATNTDNGSSGSPCFDASWGLLALHHFGDPAHKPPAYNQGIPIDAIRARLTRQSKDSVLGGDSP